jgi:hypothetical protein
MQRKPRKPYALTCQEIIMRNRDRQVEQFLSELEKEVIAEQKKEKHEADRG